MPQQTQRRASCQVQHYQQQLRGAAPLPLTHLLPVAEVEAALAAEHCTCRVRLFTPLLTVWIFLGQVLDPDHSCRQAVLRFLAWLVSRGHAGCSSNTSAYCKARKRLPEAVLARLTRGRGRDVEAQAPHAWHWHGLRVRVADGTTVSMPDTPANQQAYPHSRSQKPGLGFPLMRVVVLFSLAVGTVLDATCNPYQGKETGETAMLRSLMHSLQRGDLVLGDRYFANYWIIALATYLGLHVLFRQHQRRKVDFRTGRRLGQDDHVITWAKPQRPRWMSQELYASLAATLTLREVRLRVPKGKNRTRAIIVVSTLLDAGAYAKGELEALYRLRWQAELYLRSLKTTLQMDILRCKTPALVRKELWAHFLVYNLIRTALAQAAQRHARRPWHLSFKGALQTLNAFGGFWSSAALPATGLAAFYRAIAKQRVGQRPGRWEPRAKKRRPKPHRLLHEPRAQAKARLRGARTRKARRLY
jgi:Transposase DDE domain/Insertion element 4 transposase N-terminal